MSGENFEENKYLLKDSDPSFDEAFKFVQGASKLTTRPNRILFETPDSGTMIVLEINNPNFYSDMVFTSLAIARYSDWFADLASNTQLHYIGIVQTFVNWLNEFNEEFNNSNCYKILKIFEEFQINDREVKYSKIEKLMKIIENGLNTELLSSEEVIYLQKLLWLTKPAKAPQADGYNLTDWFDMPWLREVVGEKEYLQLESPKRLFQSFRVTVAITLLYFLEIRESWRSHFLINLNSVEIPNAIDCRAELISGTSLFDDQGRPISPLAEALLLDFAYDKESQLRVKNIVTDAQNSVSISISNNEDKEIDTWETPIFFIGKNYSNYSQIESLLMSWLIACEAVQPLDIYKLRPSHYACEYGSKDQLLLMQCKYYKGRAGSYKEPAVLMARDCWTKAQHKYIEKFEELGEGPLISPGISRLNNMPNISGTQRGNQIVFLFRLWRQPLLKARILSELEKVQASPIFLNSMLALMGGSISYTKYRYETGLGVDSYKNSVLMPLPANLFSLTHIKTTAVHAGSDLYRDSDLVDIHSHTSLTEKLSYLTDENKDWVNRCGRLTRLVLHDLLNVVYQPQVSTLAREVKEKELKTKLIETTGNSSVTIQSLKQSAEKNDDAHLIIVTDTVDTALYFLHYLFEAERVFSSLVKVRPDFVELTLLVQVEWMTNTLQRMKNTKIAKKEYEKVGIHLPKLFDHLLESIE